MKRCPECNHGSGYQLSDGRYAKNWLYPYRGVPHKYFHLYLGEICYRFNHRKEDLKPLLQKLLRSTLMSNIKPISVRSG